jgi:hypothetical protein
MDTLKGIEKLAKKAQMQKIPAFGISDQIADRLRLSRPETASFAVFDVFAGISAVAASVALYIGLNAWTHLMNPMTQFFAPLQEIRLW